MDRIKFIASKVDDNAKIIDIGCDHSYLGIELIKQNRNIKVIASDISKNALEMAKKNIDGLYEIELRCGNGLDVVEKNEINTIVISGMGAHTQIDILKKNIEKLENVDKIILSPNDNAFYIRNNIYIIGYYIDDEDIIYESNIYYPIIVLKKGNKKYNYDDLLLGPILKTKISKTVIDYYNYLIQKRLEILKKLPDSYKEKKENIINDINILKNSVK